MKKKIILMLTALAVFGLSIAVVAYNRTNTTNNNAATVADCCKGKDSCPMKKSGSHAHRSGDHAEKHANCDNCDCSCCKESAEACPMKAKKDDKATATTDAAATTEAKDKNGCGCGCSCCGGEKSDDKAKV